MTFMWRARRTKIRRLQLVCIILTFRLKKNYTTKRTKKKWLVNKSDFAAAGKVFNKTLTNSDQINMVMDYVNIIDNGAYTIKIGKSVQNEPKIVPNCIMKAKSERRRPFIGDQIEECRDASGLFYSLCFQRGYLVNWDVQKTVWDYVFSKNCAAVDFSRPTIITEPQFNFTSIQEAMTEIFFEEFECETLLRTTAADLAYENYVSTKQLQPPNCCIVIDMGYSFTHIILFVKVPLLMHGTADEYSANKKISPQNA